MDIPARAQGESVEAPFIASVQSVWCVLFPTHLHMDSDTQRGARHAPFDEESMFALLVKAIKRFLARLCQGFSSNFASSRPAPPKQPWNQKKSPDPICALDLEKWRIRHGLTIAAACELLGLPYHKWGALSKTPAAPIQDATVCMLLTLYDQYPETLPIQRAPDFLSFMRALGYAPDKPADRTQC